MPPADRPVVTALRAAAHDARHASRAGDTVAACSRTSIARSRAGVRLVQLRAPGIDEAALEPVVARAAALRARGGRRAAGQRPRGARRTARHRRCTCRRSPRAPSRTVRYRAIAGSAFRCHDAAELAHALALDADYLVAGPVRATASHPGVAGLGWQRFAALVHDCPVPVFAIGGLAPGDLADGARARCVRRGRHPRVRARLAFPRARAPRARAWSASVRASSASSEPSLTTTSSASASRVASSACARDHRERVLAGHAVPLHQALDARLDRRIDDDDAIDEFVAPDLGEQRDREHDVRGRAVGERAFAHARGDARMQDRLEPRARGRVREHALAHRARGRGGRPRRSLPGPNASAISRSAGSPGSTSSRDTTSASITGTPCDSSLRVTADLPEATPPVTATTYGSPRPLTPEDPGVPRRTAPSP